MTIVVGTDTSSAADLAIQEAARLAKDRGVELVILYVRSGGDVHAVVDPDKVADPAVYLAGMAARFPALTLRTSVVDGDPAERICEIAAEVGADAIVIGNRGAQGSRWRVKESIPNLVLRHAPCSVTIVDTRKAQ